MSNKPEAIKLLPFLVSSIKELAAGFEEHAATLHEKGYSDQEAIRFVLITAAALAGAGTVVGNLLGATPQQFAELSKDVTKKVMTEYDSIVEGNT